MLIRRGVPDRSLNWLVKGGVLSLCQVTAGRKKCAERTSGLAQSEFVYALQSRREREVSPSLRIAMSARCVCIVSNIPRRPLRSQEQVELGTEIAAFPP